MVIKQIVIWQNVFLDKCIQILYKYEYNSTFQLHKRLPKIKFYKYNKKYILCCKIHIFSWVAPKAEGKLIFVNIIDWLLPNL